jgi:hypothetical protein
MSSELASASSSSDPQMPPASSAGPLVSFVVRQRAIVAWVLIALGVISLVVSGYCVSRVLKSSTAVKPAEESSAEPSKSTDELVTPHRGEYLGGALVALLVSVAGLGVGAWVLAGQPSALESARQTEARTIILMAGGLFGLAAILLGLWLFILWFGSLVAWIDQGKLSEAKWPLIAALIFLVGAGLVFFSAQPARAEERNQPNLRRLIYATNVGLSTILLLVALVAANLFAAVRIPNQLDTTTAGAYSLELSPPTRDYLATLTTPVTAYAIIPESSSLAVADIRRLLTAAQAINPEKFSARFLSPTLNRDEITRLRNEYPQADLNEFGVLLTVGGSEKEYSFIRAQDMIDRSFDRVTGTSRISFLGESKLTSELLFLTDKKSKAIIYFSTGHGEPEINAISDPAGFSVNPRTLRDLRKALESAAAEVRSLSFDLTNPRVPDDASVVIVLDPTAPFSSAEVSALQRYLTEPKADGKKGKLIAALSPFPTPDGSQVAATGLESLLSSFGIELGNHYLLTQPGRGLGYLDIQTVPILSSPDSSNPIAAVAETQAPVFPLCREIRLAPGASGSARPEPILASYPGRITWFEDSRPADPARVLEMLLQSRELVQTKKASTRPRIVAAIVSENNSGRLAVFGSGQAFTDRASRGEINPAAAIAVLTATVNWLRDRPAVANIPAKTYGEYMPNPNTDLFRAFILPVGLTLIAIVTLGLGVWVFRRT